MKFKQVMAATAAVALMASPTMAAAQAADSVVPATETVVADSQLGMGGGYSGGFIIPLLALGAIILGILVLIDDDGEDPVSP